MKLQKIPKPPIWKTLGVAFCVCLVGLSVCVYLLFSGFKSHAEQLQETQTQLKATQLELQHTRDQRNKLKMKIDMLENIEYERGTLPPPPPIDNGGRDE